MQELFAGAQQKVLGQDSCPRSCPRCQDYAGQVLAKIVPKIWQDLGLLARSWPDLALLGKNLAQELFAGTLSGDELSPSRSEYPPCKRRVRALPCTRVIFRRPYRQETTLDLGVLVLVARCDASRETAPEKSSWTRFLPKILPKVPRLCRQFWPRSYPRYGKISASWQDLALLGKNLAQELFCWASMNSFFAPSSIRLCHKGNARPPQL